MTCHNNRSPKAGRLGGRSPCKSPSSIPRLLLVLLIPLTTMLISGRALAQSCITEVAVIYGGSFGIAPPAGFTKVGVDLNQGAGGDYIFLCYKKGIGAPITGLAVTLNGGSPPTDATYTRVNVDLNRNCGGDTDFVWLWYTKDPGCSTIREVHVQADQNPPPTGYTRINVDLNSNAGGAFIFLSYLKL
jgi:hypothetical protein